MKKLIMFLCGLLYVLSQSNFAENVQRTVVHSESLVSSEWYEILSSSNYEELPTYPESAKLIIETCAFLNKDNCDYLIVHEGEVCKNIIRVIANCKENNCKFQFEKNEPEVCLD